MYAKIVNGRVEETVLGMSCYDAGVLRTVFYSHSSVNGVGAAAEEILGGCEDMDGTAWNA